VSCLSNKLPLAAGVLALLGLSVARIEAAHAVCGDGVTDAGEQCDDGAANGAANSCCSVTCTFQPTTTTCGPQPDDPLCHSFNTCNGAGACIAKGTACTNGNGTPAPAMSRPPSPM
jgi:hypothetical protein